jgi:hypothetical protein
LSAHTRDRDSTHLHKVRPRWTWIGLVVLVAGLLLTGEGIIAESWTWAVPGLVLLVVGGILALYGGMFYDVHGGASAHGQLRDVIQGNEHEFPDATAARAEDDVKRHVRRRWLHAR